MTFGENGEGGGWREEARKKMMEGVGGVSGREKNL